MDKGAGDPITEVKLVNLTRLVASNKSISDLTRLENYIGLTYLRLDDNNISDISVIAWLTKLEGLYFQNNNISDNAVFRVFSAFWTILSTSKTFPPSLAKRIPVT